MARRLSNWIDTFIDYTSDLPSDPLLKRWSALACIAGALERRCWVTTYNTPLYPNLYVMLLAPPGIGKSMLSTRVGALWRSTDELVVGSTSLTKASLVDELAAARRDITRPRMIPAVETFYSLQLCVNELGNFITAYDNEFINFLTDVYDCGHYSERRRGDKDNPISLDKTQLTLFGCTTTSWLGGMMPEGAWDQGFISRMIMVYAGEKERLSLFASKKNTEKLWTPLSLDLNHISKLYGEFTFEDECARLLDNWHLAGNPPEPEHPRLRHYLSRRTVHVEKMMMSISAAKGDSLVLTAEDFEEALELLLYTESRMPDIFKEMRGDNDLAVIEECWHTIYLIYQRGDKVPVRQSVVFQFLQERLPTNSIQRVLDTMVKAGMFQEIQVNKIGSCYRPLEYKELG